jgi:hypothetical protein
MPLSIEDPEADRLAREVARRPGETITRAADALPCHLAECYPASGTTRIRQAVTARSETIPWGGG